MLNVLIGLYLSKLTKSSISSLWTPLTHRQRPAIDKVDATTCLGVCPTTATDLANLSRLVS